MANNTVPRLIEDETGFRVWDAASGKKIRIGKGKDRAAALAEYSAFLQHLAESPGQPYIRGGALLMSEVFAQFLQSASRPADHLVEQARRAFGHALDYFSADRPFVADSLTPPEVMRWQEWLAGKGHSYTYLKRTVGWFRRAYRWGYSRGLVDAEAYRAASEAEWLDVRAVKPKVVRVAVPAGDLVAVLPHLAPQIRAIVQVMALTGMRPSEVCGMTPGAILQGGKHVLGGVEYDLGGEWLYVLSRHKTAGKTGMGRVVGLPAAVREIVAPYLDRAADLPLFSPAERVEKVLGKCREGKRAPGTAYNHRVLRWSIRAACDKAGVPRWTAYQVRYLGAASLQARLGREAAQSILGHVSAGMTAHYAGADVMAAIRAAGST